MEIILSNHDYDGGTRSLWRSSFRLGSIAAYSLREEPSSEEAQRIYEDIEASEAAKTYPYAEFPFFGKRLIALQEFVKQHQPQNVRSLLNDRRDVAAWYTLWNNQILVFFATFTIFLMLLSLIIQIWQVMLAKQQLEQGGH